MDDPPPVPPKDPQYEQFVDFGPPSGSNAPPSSSKRKRLSAENAINYSQAEEELYGADAHTPKRTRSAVKAGALPPSDAEDEITPARPRNVRRKRGFRNLSNLNLRHAASQQAKDKTLRGSKFVEGSLNDKPSDKPPSAFTRFIRTNSGNVQQVDELMEDYHGGLEGGHLATSHPDGDTDHEHAKAEADAGQGLFKFGRNLTSSFHPITLWNKLWNETKEELKKQDLEEAEKRKRLKEEAEAQYARLQSTGELPRKTIETPVSKATTAVDISTAKGSSTSAVPTRDDVYYLSGNELPESTSKTRNLMSRLTLKRTSLSNLKFGLRRTPSEMNFNNTTMNVTRESSSSVSPVKPEFDQSTVRKQHKLTKRVSDLEFKLQQARKDLDEAIAIASPMPKFHSKYERFTPSMRSRRFAPGALPSLPSERLLFADQIQHASAQEETVTDASTTGAEEVEDETIKPNGKRMYPPRADTLFEDESNNAKDSDSSEQPAMAVQESSVSNSIHLEDADLVGTGNPAHYESNANEVNDDAGQLQSKKSKKRKSDIADAAFKPSEDEDNDSDESEIDQTNHQRKRKAVGKSSKVQEDRSDPKPANDAEVMPFNGQGSSENTKNTALDGDVDMEDGASARQSMESQGLPLDPVYEEEEDTSFVALNEEPTQPTAQATPARFTVRKRARGKGKAKESGKEKTVASSSPPQAQVEIMVESTTEETASPSKKAIGLRGLLSSPGQSKLAGRGKDFEWPDDVF